MKICFQSWTLNFKMEIRDFNEAEVKEVSSYVQTSAQHAKIFDGYQITEDTISKATNFTIIYRILNSAANYVETEALRDKLRTLLDEAKEEYTELYALVSDYQNMMINTNKHRKLMKIAYFFRDPTRNFKINKIIDASLVFAEKQTLIETEKVFGLNLENDEGKKVYGEINSKE